MSKYFLIFNLAALGFILATHVFDIQFIPGQDPIVELIVVSVNLVAWILYDPFLPYK